MQVNMAQCKTDVEHLEHSTSGKREHWAQQFELVDIKQEYTSGKVQTVETSRLTARKNIANDTEEQQQQIPDKEQKNGAKDLDVVCYSENSQDSVYIMNGMNFNSKGNQEIELLCDETTACVSYNIQDDEENEVPNNVEPVESSENAGFYKWSYNMIVLMLQKRLAMESLFKKPTCKKRKLWQQVAQHMAQHNYVIDGDMCDSKYRNLLSTYKKNKRKQIQTGERTITWPFFETMDSVLGTKTYHNVPPQVSSSNAPARPAECNSTEQNNETTENIASRSIKKRKDAVAEYFTVKKRILLEEHEKKNLRWKEQMEMRKKEVDAIHFLATVLASRHS